MPFVQGSAIEKARRNSLEYRADTIGRLIQDQYNEVLNIIATFEDHVLAFNGDGKLRSIEFSINENGDVEILGDKASRAIPVIEDDAVPAHVSKELKFAAGRMMSGRPVSPVRLRELAALVKKDEDYWMSDVVARIEESTGETEWFKMYEANLERIRTSLHGRIREIEGVVPKTHYSKIAEARLSEFEGEIKESIGILKGLFSGFVSRCGEMKFADKQEFLGAIRESLNVEAQAVVGLLEKAAMLMGQGDLPLMARAHDRLADRARTMALVSEYIAARAQPNSKE